MPMSLWNKLLRGGWDPAGALALVHRWGRMMSVLRSGQARWRIGAIMFALLAPSAVSASDAPWNILAPSVPAKSWYLVDYNSGQVLAEHNADERLPPASLTKLMTAYLVFKELRAGQIRLNDEIPVSVKAWRMPGSRMFIRAATKVRLQDLIKGLLIESGNDAAIALAEYVGGSERHFVDLMNAQAAALGMNNTHYSDATGLPHSDHYSTARDLSIVARAIIRDFPEYYARWDSRKKFSYDGITQFNRNTLLWREPGVDGMKTGYTHAAGYCLVASGMRNGMRLVVTVLGTKSERARAEAGKALLDFGFRNFETHLVFQAQKAALQVHVWMGTSDMLPAGINHDLYLTLPRGSFERLQTHFDVPQAEVAPIRRGQTIGTLTLGLGSAPLAQSRLVALTNIGSGNLLQRARDRLTMWLH